MATPSHATHIDTQKRIVVYDMDIPNPTGTDINNVITGKVTFVGFDASGYGNYMKVTTLNGKREVLYAHMDSVSVSEGQAINKGDVVGTVGNTGASTGSHLHIEYSIEGGFNTNPAFFIEGISDT